MPNFCLKGLKEIICSVLLAEAILFVFIDFAMLFLEGNFFSDLCSGLVLNSAICMS